MGTAEFNDRKSFLKGLAVRASLSTDDMEAVRVQLATLAPAALLESWFGSADPEAHRSPSVDALRKVIRRRAALFEWVYGTGSPVARDLLYVRLPSAEKRRLVNLLLATARPKLPWLDSRIVHAMAFRPSFFDRKRASAEGMHQTDWGPLYRRVGIPKGRGKRLLTIPNPALMLIQRALLQLIGPPLERTLTAGVFGNSRGVRGPTFRNAAAHRRSAFVASFDIKDFFPSVRVGDIIYGLQRAAKQGIPMVDPEKLPSLLGESPQRVELKWTPDAMRLVARLCTHRSRLPQGAPLSPILASVAFSRMDRRIIRRLRAKFGASGFKYTRYFDDITISLSVDAAKQWDGRDRAAALWEIEGCVNAALADTSFTLNAAKSRGAWIRVAQKGARSGANGPFAEVTGLIVRPSGVSMPRQVKRFIRETVHRLERHCFVEMARAWSEREKRPVPQWTGSSRTGYRWLRTSTMQRRCTAERLAVLMLLRTNRDLRVRLLNKDWYAWQAGIAQGAVVRSGVGARDVMQRLLTAHWRGQTSVRQDKPNELVFSHDGHDVCAVSSESSLDYLWLTPEDAFAVADFWHHLRGMLAYLEGCPKEGDEFKAVHQLREALETGMRRIRFDKSALRMSTQSSSDNAFTFTVDDALKLAASEFEQSYHAFARSIDFDASLAFKIHYGGLVQRVTDEPGLRDWLCVLSRLTVRTLPLLPATGGSGDASESEACFEFLRLREDIALRRVSEDYKRVAEFEKELGLSDGDIPESARCFQAQERVLWKLSSLLKSRSGEDKFDVAARFNPRSLSHEDQLTRIVDRLSRALKAARSSDGAQRLLEEHSGAEFSKERSLLVDAETNRVNLENWEHLFKVAKVLDGAARESLRPELWWKPAAPRPGTNEVATTCRNQLWGQLSVRGRDLEAPLALLTRLRNRGAHQPNREYRAEWVSLQTRIAALLGRSWRSKSDKEHPEFYAADDLRLTGHETLSAKVMLMEALAIAFERAVDERLWEEWLRRSSEKPG